MTKPKSAKNTNQPRPQNGIRIRKANSSNSKLDKMPCYVRAVTDPFSPSTEGCRVDDGCAFNTRTDHVHISSQLVYSGSGSCYMIVRPSVSQTTLVSTALSLPMPNTVATLSDVSVVGSIATEAAVAAIASVTRPVSVGIRFKNQMNFATVTGKLQIAPYIESRNFLNNVTLNAQSTVMDQVDIRTFWTNGLDPSGIMNMPGAREFAMDELIGKEVLAICRPAGPGARNWRAANASNGGITNVSASAQSVDLANTASGVSANGASMSCVASCEDWNGFILQWVGLPASVSTTFGAIEIIMHYESIPLVTAVSALVPTMAPKETSPYAFDQLLKMLQRFDWTKLIDSRATGMLARVAGEAISRSTVRGYRQRIRGGDRIEF